MIVTKIRKVIIFMLLIVLCVYFSFSFSISLNQKSERELTQVTYRVTECLDILLTFTSDITKLGSEYFDVENPKMDDNFRILEYGDNFTFDTADRINNLNRRIYGRGSLYTTTRDQEHINVTFIFDRFFKDFSAGFSNVTGINYYSKHNFMYTYSSIGADYLKKLGYYTEKYRNEALINQMNGSRDILLTTFENKNYMNENEILVSSPVYNGEELEGLISVNYSVDLINDILSNNFYQTYLLDRDGNIIASNDTEVKANNGFSNIKDSQFFGEKNGQEILDYAFNENKTIQYKFTSESYKFSDLIADKYVLFLYVPKISYLYGIFTSLIAVVVIGRIVFWLNATYEKRRIVRKEIKQKYQQVTKLNLEFEEIATKDFLTKLYNRRYLLQKIKEQVEANIKNPDANFIILMMDIDHFKKVNDTYGHAAGDEVLKSVSNTISKNVRSTDLVSRWGGEEILVVLSNTKEEDGNNIAEKIRLKVSETVTTVSDVDIIVTLSIGVSNIKMNMNFDKALTDADEALYKAKSTGRNKVVLYKDIY